MGGIEERFAQAVGHHQAGRLAEAEALYRGILREDPVHAETLHLLGVLAHHVGHHSAAETLIRRALAVYGPSYVFHSNLASVCISLGHFEEAAAQARAAIRLNPAHASAYNNLGIALSRLGRLGEAEAAFRETVRLNPADAGSWYKIGSLLYLQGKLQEAIAPLQEAIRLAPGHAQARNTLGSVFMAFGEHDAAAGQLREAIRLQPHFPEAFSNLGQTYQNLNQMGEAEQCLREAVRLEPGSVICRINLANNLRQQSRIEEAIAEYRECLRLAPRDAIALAALTHLDAEGFHTLSAAEAGGLVEAVADPQQPVENRCRMLFALGRKRDRDGQYAEAFDYYRQANDLRREIERRAGIVYDPAAYERRMDQLIASFSPDYFARVRGFGSDSEKPVFVVGMMRSGTTLVEQILASHPQIYGAGELSEMIRLIKGLPARLQTMTEFPECMKLLDLPTAASLAEDYLKKLREMNDAADRIVDKMPANYLWLGLIAAMFPKARIVHCRRNAVDTCLSCYFQDFASPHPYTSDLRHLGHYHRQYERMMAHWSAVLPLRIVDLHYEELTAQPEAVSRGLIEYCGLPWDDRCLRFNENKRTVRTASSLQVRKPMYGSSVGRWKRYEAFLGPLLEELRLCGSPME